MTPGERSETLAANAAAEYNKQANQPGATQQAPQTSASSHTVVFEVTGSGEVYGIVTDPGGPIVPDHTKIPWKRTMTVAADEDLLQVVATGRNDPGPGCRITVDGKVVVEQRIGGDAHCIYSFN
ncbi:MAG TPA: MmpS family transport accessory protein [Mycobacterium sp.]|nr:MmpS family transport accessory protein [Mycobacterium sp.]